jgi:molecular chaperone Hsp33
MDDDFEEDEAAGPSDDLIVPFQVDALDVRGRVVHLGPALDTILQRHAYPKPVSRLVGEAAALTTLLGTSLKFEGRLILQTQTDGPVHMLVVDYETPDRIRAVARFDAEAVKTAMRDGADSPEALLGRGHLAMTIDQGGDMSRYQGVVPLDGGTLEEAAHAYFAQSEQIPTRVRLAVAELLTRTPEGMRQAWRAGGILVQFLPDSGERVPIRDINPGDAPEGTEFDEPDDDDAWTEAQALVDTIEDIELIDPEVSQERLLYRLFHERGVRVYDHQPIVERCRCSRDTIEDMLRRFTPEERADMVQDDGTIEVTCEFCSTAYEFDPAELEPEAEG